MDKNKMLIDATHPEETRVVAVRNGRVEDFDFESAARKLLRGNIYLAKVTRVEPSLQAAFVDYGGNRHGFLAFNEIHPDYYQIPVADREALKQEEAEAEAAAEAELDERSRSRGSTRRRRRGRNEKPGPGMGAQPSVGETPETEAGRRRGRRDRSGSRGGRGESRARDAAALDHGREGGDVLRAASDAAPSAAPGLADDGTPRILPPPIAWPRGMRPPEAPVAEAQPLSDAAAREDLATDAGPDMADAGGRPVHDAGPDVIAHGPEARDGDADVADGDADDVGARRYEAEDEADEGETYEADGDDVDDADDTDDGDDGDDGDDDDAGEDTNGNGGSDDEQVEQVASEDDALEEVFERPRRRARQYKIQEVIKRRQIMLVQVVKEERGNKGAALTTYISLAGRYTVLMPNTARGGGISRKITQPQDRKRLKAIAEDLDVPEGMGLIIRTAGAARTKQEIKRDYEYLLRLWESVREVTLSSTAPCLVYEEGNIIKRAIRDLYSKDFDQIVVAGAPAHREAQDFMEMLMPGAGGHVAAYRDAEPLFARYGVERQLNALFSPYVTLRSGGYIVINQTEALVSVDVNSGKSTREFSIEETALNTNLEAADEIARQLKLRDLAGLIVVDFIDMEENRNNRSVERRLKDALRHDRARIQVGRISHFGLLEMSRQRLRAGVLEGSTSQCPHCQGTGIIRSIESVALAVLRGLEDHLIKQTTSLVAQTTAEVALYILNHKRAFIVEMERRYGVIVRVEASDRMHGANYAVERFAAPVQAKAARSAAVSMEWGFDREEDIEEDVEEPDVPVNGGEAETAARAGDDERRGRRRRRRRGRRDREGEAGEAGANGHLNGAEPLAAGDDEDGDAVEEIVPLARGGRRSEVPAGDDELDGDVGAEAERDDADGDGDGDGEALEAEGDREGGEPRRRGRRRGRRGGRSRRRDGRDAGADEQPSLDDADRHEWGVAEVSQVAAYPEGGEDHGGQHARRHLGLVGSAEADVKALDSGEAVRADIVETVDGGRRSDGRRGRFSASDEALRLAVRLARGGRQPSRRAAPVQPVDEAPDRSAVVPETAQAEASTGAARQSWAPADGQPVSQFSDAAEGSAGVTAPAVSFAAPTEADAAPSATVQADETATVEQPWSGSDQGTGSVPAAGEASEPAHSAANDTGAPPSGSAAEPEPEHVVETVRADAPVQTHAGYGERAHEIAAGPEVQPEVEPGVDHEPRPVRRGWWQRRFGGE